jgi:hypothetical protein
VEHAAASHELRSHAPHSLVEHGRARSGRAHMGYGEHSIANANSRGQMEPPKDLGLFPPLYEHAGQPSSQRRRGISFPSDASSMARKVNYVWQLKNDAGIQMLDVSHRAMDQWAAYSKYYQLWYIWLQSFEGTVNEKIAELEGDSLEETKLLEYKCKEMDTEIERMTRNNDKTTKRMFRELWSAQEEFEHRVNEVLANSAQITQPLMDTFKRSQDQAKLDVDKMEGRRVKVKRIIERMMSRLVNAHTRDMAKLDNNIVLFGDIFKRTSSMVEKIPAKIEAKLTNVQAQADKEKEAMVETLRNVRETFRKYLGETKQAFRETGRDVKDTYGSIANNAEVGLGYRALGFMHDVEKYEDETGNIITELRGFAEDEGARNTRQAQKVETKLDRLNGEMLKLAGKEQGFPAEAEGLMAKVQGVIGEAASEIRPLREKYQKALQKQLEDAVRRTKEHVGDQANDVMKSQRKTGLKAVGAAGAVLSRGMFDNLEKMDGYTHDMDGAAKRAQKLRDTVDENGRKLVAMSEQETRLLEEMPDRLSANVNGIIQAAKIAAKNGRNDVRAMKKSMDEAKEEVEGDAKAIETKLNSNIKKKTAAFQAFMQKFLSSSTGAIDRIEAAGQQMVDQISQKRNSTEQAVDGISENTVPELTKKAEDYIESAKGQEEGFSQVMKDAFRDLEREMKNETGLVQAHVDSAGQDVLGLVMAQSDRNTNRVNLKAERTQKLVTNTKLDASSLASKVAADLKDVDAKNQETKDVALQSEEAVEDALETGEDRLRGYEHTLEKDLEKQQVALQATETGLRRDIRNDGRMLRARRETSVASAKRAATQDVKQLTDEMHNYASGIETEAGRIIKELEQQGGALPKQTHTLNLMLEEAQGRVEATRQLGAEAASLQAGVQAQGKRNLATMSSYERHVASKQDEFKKVEGQLLGDLRKDVQDGLSEADAEAQKDVARAQKSLDEASEGANSALQTFQTASAQEVKAANTQAETLASQVAIASKRQASAEEELLTRLNHINMDHKAASEQFAKAMAAQHRFVDRMKASGDHRVVQLGTDLENMERQVTEHVDGQVDRDKHALSGLLGDAKEAGRSVQAHARTVQQQELAYANTFTPLMRDLSHTLEEGNAALSTFEEKWRGQRKDIMMALNDQKIHREQEVEHFEQTSQARSSGIGWALKAAKDLATKVSAGVQYDLGNVEADATKLGRAMKSMAGVDKMSGDRAVTELGERIVALTQADENLAKQLTGNEKDETLFTKAVQDAFKKEGADLDLAKMQLAKEQAMEKFAVQRQMSSLKAELSGDLKDVSKVGHARLDSLASDMGAKIAALYKDKELSEEARAAQIEALNKSMREKAMRILDEDARLRVDQSTAVRNLKVATDEIRQAMARIVEVEQASPSSYSLESVLEKIEESITQAATHIDYRNAVLNVESKGPALAHCKKNTLDESTCACGVTTSTDDKGCPQTECKADCPGSLAEMRAAVDAVGRAEARTRAALAEEQP